MSNESSTIGSRLRHFVGTLARWTLTAASAAAFALFIASLRWNFYWMDQFGATRGVGGGVVTVSWLTSNYRAMLAKDRAEPIRSKWKWYHNPRQAAMWWLPSYGSTGNRSGVGAPLWMLVLGSGAPAFLWWRRHLRYKPPWACPRCGYDLRGLTPGLGCPECGGLGEASKDARPSTRS